MDFDKAKKIYLSKQTGAKSGKPYYYGKYGGIEICLFKNEPKKGEEKKSDLTAFVVLDKG